MCHNKRIIKGYIATDKEIKDYKKTMEEAFIKYLKSYIKSQATQKNNVF